MKNILLFGMMVLYSNLFGQIENGMIAHFPFNNNLDDLSNSNVVLTGSGISFGPDNNADTNRAVVFDGAGSISFDDEDLRVPLPISISFWLKINSLQAFSSPIIYSEDQLGNYSGYFIAINTSGNIAMHMGDGSGEGTQFRRSFTASDVLTTGAWYHITCIYRNYDDMEVYIDCNHATGSYSGSGSTTINYLNIGGSIGYESGTITSQDRYSDIALSQLAIWDRELAPSEIAYLCEPNTVLAIDNKKISKEKELLYITDILGRTTYPIPNQILFYIYEDGSVEKKIQLEK